MAEPTFKRGDLAIFTDPETKDFFAVTVIAPAVDGGVRVFRGPLSQYEALNSDAFTMLAQESDLIFVPDEGKFSIGVAPIEEMR